MRLTFTFVFLALLCSAKSQLLTWSPSFIQESSTPIEITVDATRGNQALKDYPSTSDIYVHIGAITNKSSGPSDWRHAKFAWATTPPAGACSYLGNNKWKYTITGGLRTYFALEADEQILKIAILFRNGSGTTVQRNSDGGDMYVPVYSSGLNVRIDNPLRQPKYTPVIEPITKNVGDNVDIAVSASTTSTLKIFFNGAQVGGTATEATSASATASITSAGTQTIIAEAATSGETKRDTVTFYVAPSVTVAPLPAGVREGINYNSNCTSATLVLYAPNKSVVNVVGDFPGSNWIATSQYQMNRTPDGNYYWLTINDLTAGVEYAFNYVVDGNIYIADPYSEKVLDPDNDQYIPSSVYPNLKPYPTNANVSASKNGIVSVLQTCQPGYTWQATNYTKPESRNLITYELLVRDFGAAHSYQMLIDTISYFKRLGVNAIELMPVNEFSGNDSWGYNPTFYLAPDKYYGTKNKLKEFIDLCHQNGIAVILDVVFNQMEAGIAPQGKLYWDAARNRPAANNPWLNIAAPHPYFPYQYDLNHESPATRYLIQRTFEYWLSEYKVDGFRIDAGKGFTQKCTQVNDMCPTATGSIEDYDASRVAILERYYDSVIAKYPGTYMILEFLGTQMAEEREYAKHGFMLWGKNTDPYNQATMGYKDNSNFSKIVYNSSEEGFTTPSEMGYMESHDEERMMYKNLAYGNGAGSYNVKELPVALERQAAAASVFFTVPGPKMFWQFGERGYEISIDANGGRVAAKPPHWEYMQDANRLKLWNNYAKLINLRVSNPSTFNSTNFTYDFYDNGGLFRRFQIADPNSGGMKVTVLANFDVTSQTRTVTFQSAGTWFNYLSNGTGTGINGATGSSVSLSTAEQVITLQPGEYHVFIDREVVLPLKLVSFSGARSTNAINLELVTDKEVNVKEYSIERSLNGVDFKNIATIAAANNTNYLSRYSYRDTDAEAVNSRSVVYYRLKMTDADGKSSFSAVVTVAGLRSILMATLYPNPVSTSQLNIKLSHSSASPVTIRIEDVNGRIYKKLVPPTNNAGAIPVNIAGLGAGVYILKVETGNDVIVQRFIKH